MKKSYFFLFAILIITAGIGACKKSSQPTPTKITPTLQDSLIGTYLVKSVLWTDVQGQVIQLIQGDSCLLDNEVRLDSTTVSFIDSGISCGFNYGGNWSIVNDSLRFTAVHYTGTDTLSTSWDNADNLHYCPEPDGGQIVSFDGKTLVLQGSPALNTVVVSEWIKQ